MATIIVPVSWYTPLGQGQVEQVSEGSNNEYTLDLSIYEEMESGPKAVEEGRRDI